VVAWQSAYISWINCKTKLKLILLFFKLKEGMKRIAMYSIVLCLAMYLTGCGGGDDGGTVKPPTFQVTVYSPVAIDKTQTDKVFVHMMPWFESPATTTNGKWGSHWTMANKNPDVITDDKRQIASFYYPLTGPYASSDKDIIEYQLLLMKFSGIDGVLIDWYGTMNMNDYPANLKNAEAIISLMDEVGLKYGIVYEDWVMQNAGDDDAKIAAAKTDMNYVRTHYFPSPNYITVDSKPLLLTFGPQTFETAAKWTDIFSVFSIKPNFLTLWYESGEAGSNAGGEYSWVYQDGNSHLTHLDNFYAKSTPTFKMGSAYPGFKDFYTEGGWTDNVNFVIDHNGTETFTTTLDKAIEKVNYIQLATWNDYGEGTMIEPTAEFGYSFLTTLQTKLGVDYTQTELELVAKLYELRLKNKNSALNTKKLDQVFYYLVSLQFTKAEELLNEIDQ
jgi:hypothetical protein